MSSNKATTSSEKQGKGSGKKRAAVEQEDDENVENNAVPEDTSSPFTKTATTTTTTKTPYSSSSSSSTGENGAKRTKSTANDIPKHLTCSLTQKLMVDPVVADDGNTYERADILKWIATNSTSPMDLSCPLDASRLMSNGMAKQMIEQLVESGELDDELCADYLERKEVLEGAQQLSPEYAQKLFDEGKVEDAAELGHAKAQGFMAEWCYWGSHGVAKDEVASVEWAKKAADGGDRVGQFRLGYAYNCAEGGLPKDWAMALKWYVQAAEQGHATSMTNTGYLYEHGGPGVAQNVATAASWYRKSAEAGCKCGQHNLGCCYYQGWGVTKNVATARSWYKKAADQDHLTAIRKLATMMVKGDGGEKDIKKGITLWEKAVAKGDEEAQENLDMLSSVSYRM